jgi:hypothetical protein
MSRVLAVLLLISGCDFIDEAARRPGELKRGNVAEPAREEKILNAFFDVDFAQRKVAHLELSDLVDFDSVSQPRPRIHDVISSFGPADATTEVDLSPFGVSSRALVYHFGRLGLATPANGAGEEVFWTLIAPDSVGPTKTRSDGK